MTQEQSSLFKSYDVRGTYPNINGTIAYWTGYALVKEVLLKEGLEPMINIVHDHRNSSPELYKCIVKGVQDAGGTVRPLGLGSTDMMYAACQHFECAGIMITASHNPPQDNGIKILKKVPQMLGIGTGLEAIRDSQYFTDLKQIDVNSIPEIQNDEESKKKLIEFYIGKIKQIGEVDEMRDALAQRKLKVVVDAGNGIGGYTMQFIKDIYPEIEFVPLYWELDGNYPNHVADPLVDANVLDLQNKIREIGADFGIAFDGDADRGFIIDENGNRVIGDYLIARLGKHFLQKYFAGKIDKTKFEPVIVYNYPSSRCTPDIVTQMGGKAIASMQGHVSMKRNMSENKAMYGGEHSGHHYFGDYAYMDGGVFAAAVVTNILVTENIKASQLTEEFRNKYLLSGELNFKLAEVMDAAERLKLVDAKLKQKYPDAEFNYLDGVTVLYPDFKFNVRLSNTEPLLRLNLEVINRDGSKSRADVDQRVNEVKETLGL